jgi:ribonuclease Z
MQLDCGFRPHAKFASHVFVTHCHGDHSGSIMNVISRHLLPDFYMPEESCDEAAAMLDAYVHFKLFNRFDTLLPSYTLHRMKGGQSFPLPKSKDKVVDTFSCTHSVPTVGFGFSVNKKALKPEFQGKPGKELGKLRKEGVELDYTKKVKMFAFLGDTSAGIFETDEVKSGALFEYPLVFIECSFLGDDPDDRKRADKTKHMHWEDLKPVVQKNPQTFFVLIHFSLRYSEVFIREFFEKEGIPNVMPWVASQDCVEENSPDPEENE